jgi:hypothetical protein
MTNPKYNDAIDTLLGELDEQQKGVVDTKKTINALRRRNGEPPLFSEAELGETQTINPSRPDLYYGKPLATACREYLELRRQACKAEDVLDALEKGGFDFDALGYKKNDRLRSLSISMAKNTAIFHRLPNGTFGLLAWYPEATTKTKPAKNNQEMNSEGQKKNDEEVKTQ